MSMNRLWLSHFLNPPSSQSHHSSSAEMDSETSPFPFPFPSLVFLLLRLFLRTSFPVRSGDNRGFSFGYMVQCEFFCWVLKFYLLNFDDVLVPEHHVSRSYNDTYYVDSQTVLRCHTSAHQAEVLRKGLTHFLVTGDVYRRDSIDSTHYPIFHQMEGVRVFTTDDWEALGMDGKSFVAKDLKKCLEGLPCHLFGAVEMRWIDTFHLPIHHLNSRYIFRKSGWKFWVAG